ncbi:unannotated protein [freshwater metagenome]|uniref:Unannotated protein n=1 Tax=freshwater metagenome TaxID=449393 RepID=A0A6J6TPA2_9ZZZZ
MQCRAAQGYYSAENVVGAHLGNGSLPFTPDQSEIQFHDLRNHQKGQLGRLIGAGLLHAMEFHGVHVLVVRGFAGELDDWGTTGGGGPLISICCARMGSHWDMMLINDR